MAPAIYPGDSGKLAPTVISGNNPSKFLETLGPEAVVAAIYHEHIALSWRLAVRTAWTRPGRLPAIAAFQQKEVSLLNLELCRTDGRDYNVITMATTSRIVRIGNSRGIRVPKALLEQAQLPEEVELQAEPGRLIVRAHRRTRAGWAEAAAQMHSRNDDQLLDSPAGNRFDAAEWVWR